MIKLSILSAILSVAACAPTSDPVPQAAKAEGFKLETYLTGLEIPWAIAFGPDKEMYINERAGRVRIVRDGKLDPKPLFVVPDLVTGSEIGLEAFVLHPDFKSNHYAYLSYGYRQDAVKVVRYKIQDGKMAEDRVIIQDLPAAMNHAGCQLGFGPDAKLYVTVGDATTRQIAQDLNSLGGKTLRLNDDGTVPKDNPFIGKAGARPEIYSYGHRNAQGLAWQPGTDLMWQTEHGPSGFDGPGGGDEVNIVPKGQNMGWPLVHHDERKEGTVPPLITYTPAQAPGACTFYNSDKIPGFKGNFLFCCLKGGGVMRFIVDGPKLVRQEKLFQELGRCRAIAVGPDGAIYFSTSNRDGRGNAQSGDDRIMRIVAAG